jgi:hypothetical protein
MHLMMFPLNDQPDGLSMLLGRFENGEAIYRFIHEHLSCGALVALSFVRARYPEVDMDLVKTLPLTPSGRVEMDAHYSACKQAADCLAGQIIVESDHQRANQAALVTKTRSPL